jgi:ribosome biogenesis SPOUT family RNA methylase Rps3
MAYRQYYMGGLILTSIVPLDQMPYLDFPELKFSEHESTEMPFRYVKGADGKPIMPKVRLLGCQAG